MLSFDPGNHTAYFIAEECAPLVVNSVKWSIAIGSAVKAGDVVGKIRLGRGRRKDLVAPAGCEGTVSEVNGSINYAYLGDHPPTWAYSITT